MTDREKIETVLAQLTEREQMVLRLRFGFDTQPKTLAEIAKILPRADGGVGVIRERVRQIEGKALRRLRHPIRSTVLKDIELPNGEPRSWPAEFNLLRAIFPKRYS